MSSFLTNTIEVVPSDEVPSANNPYAPRYVAHSLYNDGYMLSYYNPYLRQRVNILKFGEGPIPTFGEGLHVQRLRGDIFDKIAVDHYIQHNGIQNTPLYLDVQKSVHRLRERNYHTAPSENKITNVKTHLNRAAQPAVDRVAAILRNEFIPETIHDKIVQHAVERALGQNRFILKGGKKKTMKSKKRTNKTRGRRHT
jgi:hypothetical protein